MSLPSSLARDSSSLTCHHCRWCCRSISRSATPSDAPLSSLPASPPTTTHKQHTHALFPLLSISQIFSLIFVFMSAITTGLRGDPIVDAWCRYRCLFCWRGLSRREQPSSYFQARYRSSGFSKAVIAPSSPHSSLLATTAATLLSELIEPIPPFHSY